MRTIKPAMPSFSTTIKTEVVCPNDTNPMGILQGGRLVQWMDIAAAISAQTYSGRVSVTASIREVNFHHPARLGDVIHIRGCISRAFTTSMEIRVEAMGQSTGNNKKHLIADAVFIFVALDENAKPVRVPGLKSPGKMIHSARKIQAAAT